MEAMKANDPGAKLGPILSSLSDLDAALGRLGKTIDSLNDRTRVVRVSSPERALEMEPDMHGGSGLTQRISEVTNSVNAYTANLNAILNEMEL